MLRDAFKLECRKLIDIDTFQLLTNLERHSSLHHFFHFISFFISSIIVVIRYIILLGKPVTIDYIEVNITTIKNRIIHFLLLAFTY